MSIDYVNKYKSLFVDYNWYINQKWLRINT